jgi:hypothetical protein
LTKEGQARRRHLTTTAARRTVTPQRREVWRLADNAALLSLTRSDQVADHHQSGRNTDTGLEGRVRLEAAYRRSDQLQRGARGSLCVVLVGLV